MLCYTGYLICKHHPGGFLNLKYARFYGVMIVLILLCFIYLEYFNNSKNVLIMSRNFYGSAMVKYSANKDRLLLKNGSTLHGVQIIDINTRKLLLTPTAYFGKDSAVGIVDKLYREKYRNKPLNIGEVGLGAGIIASYGQQGDTITFFEIDPKIEQFARKYFSFLKDSKAKVNVVLGDGRLSIAHKNYGPYDILIIDAFNGDAIPVHLLTREAIELYLNNINDDGLIVFNISNKYVDLSKVLCNHAREFKLYGVSIVSKPHKEDVTFSCKYIVLSRSNWFIKQLHKTPPLSKDTIIFINETSETKALSTWTDNYSNLFSIMNF